MDSETANGFEFSEKLSELTLKLNTITSSEIKNYPRQIVTFLGTDGLEYESVTLTVSKIGKDKGIGIRNLKKMCDLFKLNNEQTKHIMSSASNKHRKCHILLGLKNIQMFDRSIRAEELNTFQPSCMPNLCFKKQYFLTISFCVDK